MKIASENVYFLFVYRIVFKQPFTRFMGSNSAYIGICCAGDQSGDYGSA